MFILPQLIIILHVTFALGDAGGSSAPLLIGSVCSVVVFVSGMLIGYRGYIRSDEET